MAPPKEGPAVEKIYLGAALTIVECVTGGEFGFYSVR